MIGYTTLSTKYICISLSFWHNYKFSKILSQNACINQVRSLIGNLLSPRRIFTAIPRPDNLQPCQPNTNTNLILFCEALCAQGVDLTWLHFLDYNHAVWRSTTQVDASDLNMHFTSDIYCTIKQFPNKKLKPQRRVFNC